LNSNVELGCEDRADTRITYPIHGHEKEGKPRKQSRAGPKPQVAEKRPSKEAAGNLVRNKEMVSPGEHSREDRRYPGAE
jgi:hypothetical protein